MSRSRSSSATPTQALPLGPALANGEGDLTVNLTIPTTVPQGTWAIYARGSDGGAVSAQIIVRGSPAAPSDEQAPPDRNEQSFPNPNASPTTARPATTAAPSPTAVAVVVDPSFKTRSLPGRPAEAPALVPGSPSPDPGPWLIVAGGGIGGVTLLVRALLPLRSPARADPSAIRRAQARQRTILGWRLGPVP